MENFSVIIEPDELDPVVGKKELLIVDLCSPEVYERYHIPGSIHLDYSRIVASRSPVTGLLPPEEELSTLFSSIGLTPERHVVAYDDEGGGRASRFLWTLMVLGHTRLSLLNGGLVAWANEGHELDREPVDVVASDYRAAIGSEFVANRDYILSRLEKDDLCLVDARSPDEFWGIDIRADRGGHIPGAVNLDWSEIMDRTNNLRLLSDFELAERFYDVGALPEKEIIVYCQTHHRSSLTFIALKKLGYPKVKGYPGAWSDWGNSGETPVVED